MANVGYPCVVSTTSVRNPTDLGARRHVRANTGDARGPYVPYAKSTCEYGLLVNGKVAIAQRLYVVSTYNSLTTCATNDACNHSRPEVVWRPHSYTLRTVRFAN
ncbi:hypothetical protein Bbelb_118590 [Branchiostoma belcheri]|nr:hypothetical protein Bbelb_118590 [Branchiostoma belcheri]